MPISTRQLVGSTFALLVLGFVALAVIIGATIWLGERERIYSQDLFEVRDVKALAVDLRAALQTAESSQRGYLYTGNEIYLAPYDLAKRRATAAAAGLPASLASYPDLAGAMRQLSGVIAEKITEMDELILLKRDGRDADALARVRTNRGKLLMDEANMLLTGVTLATDGRLAQLVLEQEGNALWLRLVSFTGGAVILGAALLAIWAITAYTQELNAARRELSSSNERLEQRVASRTAELAIANDEMRAARDRAEILLAEVNHRVANSLALVASLIGIQMRSISSAAAKSALEETQARVQAIAQAHKRLYDGKNVQEVALDEYLAALLDQFKTTVEGGGGVTLKYELEPLHLRTDSAINLGVVVSEWALNAFKYAYPQGKGEVRIALRRDGQDAALLSVEDDGVGRSESSQPQGTGVGTRIANAMATSMRATIEYISKSPGTVARLRFPLAA
jgi:two-component sensor histidine kinase